MKRPKDRWFAPVHTKEIAAFRTEKNVRATGGRRDTGRCLDVDRTDFFAMVQIDNMQLGIAPGQKSTPFHDGQ